MKKAEKGLTGRSGHRSADRPVTSAELGRYLKNLAFISRDPRLGNKLLSAALVELADFLVAQKGLFAADMMGDFHLSSERLSFANSALLREMKGDAIRAFLLDDTRTKADLIQLGWVRFGISQSRLQKIARAELVRIILAALEHEESLGIISKEAKRGGVDRSS